MLSAYESPDDDKPVERQQPQPPTVPPPVHPDEGRPPQPAPGYRHDRNAEFDVV